MGGGDEVAYIGKAGGDLRRLSLWFLLLALLFDVIFWFLLKSWLCR